MARAYHLRNLRLPALLLAAVALLGLTIGCETSPQPTDFRPVSARSATQPSTTQRSDEVTFRMFSVFLTPPEGWTLKTTSLDDRHEHMTWVSPSGQTAVGALFFKLPWPVGHELAFRYGFLAEMRKREGEGEVLEKRWDPEIEGLRFIVNSKNFRVTAKFLVRGLRGFATYSGTKRAFPVNTSEEQEAIRVRESLEFAGEIPTTQPSE